MRVHGGGAKGLECANSKRATLTLCVPPPPTTPCRVLGRRCDVLCARPCAALGTVSACTRHRAALGKAARATLPRRSLCRTTLRCSARCSHTVLCCSAPYSSNQAATHAGARLWVSRSRRAGLGLLTACLHLPLPGSSAGGFGARFPALWARAGGRGCGWENRLLLPVVALEREEEDEDTRAGVPALPQAPQAGRPQPSPFPQDFTSRQNCGPVACGCARDARAPRGLPPGTTSTTWTRTTPASRSLVPSSTRPRSSAAWSTCTSGTSSTETSSPRTCCWTTTVRRAPCPPASPPDSPLQPDRSSLGEGPALINAGYSSTAQRPS